MKCKKCGSKVLGGEKYCSQCGTVVKSRKKRLFPRVLKILLFGLIGLVILAFLFGKSPYATCDYKNLDSNKEKFSIKIEGNPEDLVDQVKLEASLTMSQSESGLDETRLLGLQSIIMEYETKMNSVPGIKDFDIQLTRKEGGFQSNISFFVQYSQLDVQQLKSLEFPILSSAFPNSLFSDAVLEKMKHLRNKELVPLLENENFVCEVD